MRYPVDFVMSQQETVAVGVKAMPRTQADPHFPGHVGISWKVGARRIYRDFRFRPTDLPPEYREPSKWREFLFDRDVPGYVETGLMLRDAHERTPQDLLCLEWIEAPDALQKLEENTKTGRHGRYSFSPKPDDGIHNCVTWAFTVLHQSTGRKLPMVRDGRMKLAIEALRDLGASPAR